MAVLVILWVAGKVARRGGVACAQGGQRREEEAAAGVLATRGGGAGQQATGKTGDEAKTAARTVVERRPCFGSQRKKDLWAGMVL